MEEMEVGRVPLVNDVEMVGKRVVGLTEGR
jgi:hypothetical protein